MTIYVIEITCGKYDEKFTYIHKQAFRLAAIAHQKAHEIEQKDSDCNCTVKAVTVH